MSDIRTTLNLSSPNIRHFAPGICNFVTQIQIFHWLQCTIHTYKILTQIKFGILLLKIDYAKLWNDCQLKWCQVSPWHGSNAEDKDSRSFFFVRSQHCAHCQFCLIWLKCDVVTVHTRCSRVVTDFLPYPKFSKSLLSW